MEKYPGADFSFRVSWKGGEVFCFEAVFELRLRSRRELIQGLITC